MKEGNDFQFLIDKDLLEKAKQEARKKRVSFSKYIADLLLESLDEGKVLSTEMERNISICSIYLNNDLKEKVKDEARKRKTSITKIICFLLQEQIKKQ